MNVEARVAAGIPSGEGQDQHDSTEQILQLSNLLQLMRLRWLRIVVLAFFPLVAATAVIYSLTPVYSAFAILSFDQRTNSVTDADAVLSRLTGDAATLQAQIQLLRSRTFLSRIVEQERLLDDPSFNRALLGNGNSSAGDQLSAWLTAFASWFKEDAGIAEEDVKEAIAADLLSQGVSLTAANNAAQSRSQFAMDAILEGMQRSLLVSASGSAISIGYRSQNPQQAARMANVIATTYIDDLLNAKFEATETASRFLSDRVTELGSQLKAAETAAAQFRSNNSGVETGQGLASPIDQQLTALSSQLVTAKLILTEQTAKVSRIRELQQSGRSFDVAQVVDSPMLIQLRTEASNLQRQEAELSTRYGPRHPRIIDLESQKVDLQRKIAAEVNRITQLASNDVDVAQAKVTSLEQSMQGLERAVSQRNQSAATLKQLEDRTVATRSQYEASLQRFEQVKDREEVQRPDARILSYATAPRNRDFPPSKAVMFALAVPGSLFFGFFVAVFGELLVSGFRTSAQVERSLALPVLAMAPEVKGRKAKSVINLVNDNPCSSFAESIRGVQLGLCLPDADRPPRVILVTSAMPREGKSTLALSLARSAARDGKKVVLMDCDLRRPKLLSLVRAGKVKKGLVHALLGRETIENCLHKDTRSEVLILAPESTVENPALLLGSLEMEKLIQDLRGLADLVIIDSAPLLPVNDTKLLIRLIDTMLLVIRWERTPRNAAMAAARSLFDLHAPIAGVVVTRADPKQYYAYSYGLKHYASYAEYYRD